MAKVELRIADVEPEDSGKPKRSKQADAPPVALEPDAEALEASVEPELPFARPAPKKRGRK